MTPGSTLPLILGARVLKEICYPFRFKEICYHYKCFQESLFENPSLSKILLMGKVCQNSCVGESLSTVLRRGKFVKSLA